MNVMDITCKDLQKVLPPSPGKTYLTNSDFQYFHYGCDGFDDRGWGCGYRTLQSICSWIIKKCPTHETKSIPDIRNIQNILVEMEDKPISFIGSRDWIGSVEVGLVIDQIFDIPCKILHVKSGIAIKDHVEAICEHFVNNSCLLMMGGDTDCSSKGVAGIHIGEENVSLLVVDPHFCGVVKSFNALKNKWIKWIPLEDLDCSFYNICLPQIKNSFN